MIRRQSDVASERKPGPFDGCGEITVRSLLETPEEMYEKGRVFAHTTVYPGSAIGYHVHNQESETYYILSGEAAYNDNGKIVKVKAGDVTFAGDGEGHGIEVLGDQPVEMIALILYK